MTHRVFSRNASSSRAIPVWKIIEDILNDTVMPLHWGKNQPGMQAFEEQDALVWYKSIKDDTDCPSRREAAWLEARDRAIDIAQAFDAAGYHKQIVNRILEPFAHINVVVTSVNFSNFFGLRSHPDAQPEIKALSDAMLEAYKTSTPNDLEAYDWHLPYILDEDRVAAQEWVKASDKTFPYRTMPIELLNEFDMTLENLLLIAVSVARCARTSYKLHDGSPTTFEKDLELYARLLDAEPLHASPAEHQATWTLFDEHYDYAGNLPTYVQFRKTLPGEFISEI